MSRKSSNLASAAFLVLTLISPAFAQHIPATSGQLWSWFGSCVAKTSMGIQIALNGKVIYRSSFPVCPIGDRSKAVQKTVVFSMKGGHVFQGEYHTTATQTIEGNIWQAGTDPGVILLGISFDSQNQILLNTIHTAKVGRESRSEIDRGLIVRTFPVPTSAGMSQDRPPKVVVVPSTTSAIGPQWDKGVVDGRTYKNASVGLEVTPATGLEFGNPELMGNTGTVPLVVTITAVSAPKFFSGRDAMAFYADALADYPENQRSTEAYLRKVMHSNQREGFEPLNSSAETVLGGTTFARQDFQKESRYEAVLVKACKSQAVVFIFAGSDHDGLTKLIEATRVKLDSERSGCGSNVPTPTHQ